MPIEPSASKTIWLDHRFGTRPSVFLGVLMPFCALLVCYGIVVLAQFLFGRVYEDDKLFFILVLATMLFLILLVAGAINIILIESRYAPMEIVKVGNEISARFFLWPTLNFHISNVVKFRPETKRFRFSRIVSILNTAERNWEIEISGGRRLILSGDLFEEYREELVFLAQ